MAVYPWLTLTLTLTAITSSRGSSESPGVQESLLPTLPRKAGTQKPWTGFRLQSLSDRSVLYNQQTVAVVERDPVSGRLINCELLQTETEKDRRVALISLSKIRQQSAISFPSMMELIEQCRELPTPLKFHNTRKGKMGLFAALKSHKSITFPGSKWCGRGDTAATYYDLGVQEDVDRCCRSHDFCPINIVALKKQYNVTNLSISTMSDCECDRAFHDCLKNTKSWFSGSIEAIYFEILHPDCLN